jgi:hypothetical protein
MSELDYTGAGYPVRSDLQQVHRDVLQQIAAPGTWWSGEDRLRIAEEARAARDCALCAERKSALSPASVDGQHDGPGLLGAEAIDTIHRIVTDPGRLTRSFVEQRTGGGESLDVEHYVELISVTVVLNALDVFARAIGVSAAELPASQPGEPSRARPVSARVLDAWVPQVPAGEEGGEDWRALYETREFVPQIGRALSLVPAEVEQLQQLAQPHYMALDNVGDPAYSEPGRKLDRLQTELIASRVSAINECFY